MALAFMEAEQKKAADKDEYALEQPDSAPGIVVGMHIEVLTPLVDNESGKSLSKKWLPGKVVCISDGNQTVTEWGRKKRKVRGRNPVGWSCVQFYDGEEDWYKLEGASFNNSAQRS